MKAIEAMQLDEDRIELEWDDIWVCSAELLEGFEGGLLQQTSKNVEATASFFTVQGIVML